jgi:hypothetical protein
MLLLATVACAQSCPPSPTTLIDDFTAGQGIVATLHRVNESAMGKIQTGQTILGGVRFETFFDTFNQFNGPAELGITKDANGNGALLVSAGVRVGAVLQLVYGRDENGKPKPLHYRPPSGCDRVRVTFDSLSRPVNFIMDMIDKSSKRFRIEVSLPESSISGGPFCVDFPFAAFRAADMAKLDFEPDGVDAIALEVVPHGAVLANSYALTRLEAAGTSTPNKCTVVPTPK